MRKISLLLIITAFIITYLVIYKAFFTSSPLVWGDAPYFYSENLRELFHQPLFWNNRTDNFGSSQGSVLWLYLPTFLFGLLNRYLNLSSELLIRIIFYFPATILAILGSFIFLRKLSNNIWAVFLGTFLYSFNTFFLAEIDGGPVGLALAYGLFPLVILSLANYLDRLNLNNFIYALICLFLISNIDLRAAAIAVMLVIFWLVLKIFPTGQPASLFKKLGFFLILIITVFALNSFWVIPFIMNGSAISSSAHSLTAARFIKITDALLLYNPHFPNNEFGKILPLPFYFWFLPIILFSGLLLNSKKYLSWVMMFLVWAFLSKGDSFPFGNVYALIVEKIPFGIAFRDPSKFYIPLLLSASVLLALAMQKLLQKTKSKGLSILLISFIFFYLLLLIHPALLGKMSGVLGEKDNRQEYLVIKNKLAEDKFFFRSLWFDEKPPLAFGTWASPVLSANSLYLDRPFASMIDGRYDLYQFLIKPEFPQWLDLLGIKYLFFPQNERRKNLSAEDKRNRQDFLDSLETIKDIKKLEWPLSFPVYQSQNSKPQIFGQKKLLLILGGEDIYQEMAASKNFSLANQGFVFLEDGKLDFENLRGISSDNTDLILVRKDRLDLSMSFLKNQMVSFGLAKLSDWGFGKSEDYLSWKYELLKGDIRTYDFDFGLGVAYSSIKGEKIAFNLKVPNDAKYYLGVRYLSATDSVGIKINWQGNEEIVKSQNNRHFNWYLSAPAFLKKGETNIVFENMGGFNSLNSLAIINEGELSIANSKTDKLMGSSRIFRIEDSNDWEKVLSDVQGSYTPFNYSQKDPASYLIFLPQGGIWLVFSEHFDQGWRLGKEKPLPFYSMINGFWLPADFPPNVELKYKPQEDVDLGIKLSLFWAMFLAITLLAVKVKKWYF